MRTLGLRLRNLFARRGQTRISAETLRQRISRVAESLLDNERLTADLDDSAAKELLDWGLSAARQIAQGTTDVQDDEHAEQAMYPRLRATRRLMRAANLWMVCLRQGDNEGSAEALSEIAEQAGVIYGRTFTPPSEEQRAAFMSAQSELIDNPPQMIANLRRFFER